MSGSSAVLDSNVIIDISKGIVSMYDMIHEYDFLYTSVISYVETLGYNFEDVEERETVEQILAHLEIVELNKEIGDVAIGYRKKKKIKLPDAFVLATAKSLKADLITSDEKDFKNIDSTVKIIVPKRIIPPADTEN
jgi:predicted nucleic acid-binding protein